MIISSVKTRQELPLHLQLAGKTKVYKLMPTSFFAQNIDLLIQVCFRKTDCKAFGFIQTVLVNY